MSHMCLYTCKVSDSGTTAKVIVIGFLLYVFGYKACF